MVKPAINPIGERLIRPLARLQPDILFAALLRRPLGVQEGWLSLIIRDGSDPLPPHALVNVALRLTSDGRYRVPGAPATHSSPAPLVRALCVGVQEQLGRELEQKSPQTPPPRPEPTAEPRRSKQPGNVRSVDVTMLSAMASPRTRRRLIASAVIALAAINRAPADVLPAIEMGDDFLPCGDLPGWFVLPPPKPSRATRTAARSTAQPAVHAAKEAVA